MITATSMRWDDMSETAHLEYLGTSVLTVSKPGGQEEMSRTRSENARILDRVNCNAFEARSMVVALIHTGGKRHTRHSSILVSPGSTSTASSEHKSRLLAPLSNRKGYYHHCLGRLMSMFLQRELQTEHT